MKQNPKRFDKKEHERRTEKFREFLSNLPDDFLRKKAEDENKKTAEDHENFKVNFLKNRCSFCGYRLDLLPNNRPCLHWLLYRNRKKFKKEKHFKKIYQNYSFHQIDCYLRWVANLDRNFSNISNLKEEKDEKNFIEHTIVCREIEWSFVSSKSDLEGHPGSNFGKEPHYHFQMRVNGMTVIDYNDFHIPFTDHDFFIFDLQAGKFDPRIGFSTGKAAGMQELMDVLQSSEEDDVVNLIKYTQDKNKAQFRTQVLITAKPGETISGDQINQLFERQKKTKESFAKLAKEIKGATSISFMSPDNFPEIARRTPKNRGKKRRKSYQNKDINNS